MAGGNQPHRRCNVCKTCKYVTTPRTVYMTFGVVLALAILPAPYTQFYLFIGPPDSPYKEDQPLAVEEACFWELKKKISSAKYLGVYLALRVRQYSSQTPVM